MRLNKLLEEFPETPLASLPRETLERSRRPKIRKQRGHLFSAVAWETPYPLCLTDYSNWESCLTSALASRRMLQPRRMTRPTTPGLRVLAPKSSLRHNDSSKAILFQRRLTCAHLASMNLGSQRNTARMSSSDILLNLSGKEKNMM